MIREFWNNISDRERRIVAVGGCFVGAVILYALVFRPVNANYQRYQDEVAKKGELLQWMRASSVEARKLAAAGQTSLAATEAGSPLTLIDKTAKRFSVSTGLKKVEPEDNDGVRVWLEEVVFTDIIKWARLLERQYLVQIDAISVEAGREAGYVKARITFRKGGV